MNSRIKNYGPALLAGIWLTTALVQPTFYHMASAAAVSLLSLALWMEWHQGVFK